MVIFAAIAMLILVVSGFVLLWGIDWGTQDPTDGQLYLFLSMIGVGLPLVWTVLNVGLLATRGQTGGQYVAGVRTTRADGSPLSISRALLWWICFNPLLFSWPLAAVAGGPIAVFIIVGWAELMMVVWGLLMTLCIACPIVALVSASLHERGEAFHDRVVGAIAVPVE
jgi:hypothetical protein